MKRIVISIPEPKEIGTLDGRYAYTDEERDRYIRELDEAIRRGAWLNHLKEIESIKKAETIITDSFNPSTKTLVKKKDSSNRVFIG